MPVQNIRQRRNRRVSRNVPRHLREFVAQGQAQLKFQIIAHSVVVLLQAARLALPGVLGARRNLEELEDREVAVAERLPKATVNALGSKADV